MNKKRLAALVVAGATVISSAIVFVLAASTTVVVQPGDLQGWQTQVAQGAQPTPVSTPSVTFVEGPATPPLGSGSVRLSVGSDGTATAQLRQTGYAATVLPTPTPTPPPDVEGEVPYPAASNELSALTYSTYVVQPGTGSEAPYIVLEVDYNDDGTADDALFFEPQYQSSNFCPSNPQPSVTTNTWQTWNALRGCWYSFNGVAGSGPGASVKPLRDIGAAQPNAKIVNTAGGDGGVRVVAGLGGSMWANFVGNVDNFQIGVGEDTDTGPNTTIYDFESGPGATPTPTPSTDVGVIKQANAELVRTDSDVTYTIAVTNNGHDADNVTLQDTLPGTMTFVSLTQTSGPTWSCMTPSQGAGGTINCTIASLPDGTTSSFTLVGHIPAGTSPNTSFQNTAKVTTSMTDTNSENNSSTTLTRVVDCFGDQVVTTQADSGPGSLRQAILDACSGSTITFDPDVFNPAAAPHTITLTSDELLIDKNLKIQGPGANILTVKRSTANGTPNFRIFEIASTKTANISGITISNGRTADGTAGVAGADGGAILNNSGATLNLTNVSVSGNTAGNGGSNGAGGNGGGIENLGTLTLTNSTVSGNAAGNGGVNGAGGQGGGIYNSGTMTLTNATVSGNQTGNGGATASGGDGGGIYNASGTLSLINTTISNNKTGTGSAPGVGGSGGGVRIFGGTVNTKNTIIAGNSVAAGGQGADAFGTLNSQDYNLIGSTPGVAFTGTTTHNILGQDAKLGPLADNGGPTQTMSPLPGSPAINAGDNGTSLPPDTFDLDRDDDTAERLPVDQRGFARVVFNKFDIGAVEVQAGTPDHLSFSVQPSNTFAVASITPAVTVQILDLDNNLTTSNANVTVSIGNNPGGGTLSGTTTVAAVNGTATFSNLSINRAGVGYTLTASSTVLIGATSNAFNITSPATVSGTKTVSGTFNANGSITYTVVLSNAGPAAQLDNPGNEFTDVLPAGLTLTSASASSGTAVATVATNTVTWNGLIPSGGSVTITIQATIKSGQEGATINNQGSIAFDADGNGTNESASVTDDPNVAGNSNPTSFHVNAPPTITAVGITRTAGTASSNSKVADISDAEDAKNSLSVKVNDKASDTVNGVTVSNLKADAAGAVTADVVAACGATTANFTLKVTDSGGLSNTATLTVTVNANTSPTLTYNSPQTVAYGGSITVNPTAASDNGSISGFVVQSKGTYTGTISVNGTTGVVSVSGATPAGQHDIVIRATDNCGATTDSHFTLDVGTAPSVSIGDASATESSSGTTAATFTVTLSAAINIPATVNYATADGTAHAGTDYQAQNGTLTFNPGETQKTITITIIGHSLNGPSANFFVNLSDPVNATISRGQGTGTIQSQANTIQFSSASYSVNESALRAAITVTRLGDISSAASVDYATSDQSGLNNCSQVTGMASQRCDYAISVGTLRFAAGEGSKSILIPIVNDVYVEGPESFGITLSRPVGASEGAITGATVNINDDDNGVQPNPIDSDEFFVRQLYIDLLDREPEPPGLQAWLDKLHSQCQPPTDCDRIAVALGFVKSAEFADRGYFTFRFYTTALGRDPHYAEFIPDMARVSGFLSSTDLEANKAAFVAEFMSRQEFKNLYDPTIGSPQAYVDKLLQTAGLPNHPSRNGWIDGLTNGTLTRAQVLRQLVESVEVFAKFYNRAFIVMHYFGFLRRDPDANFQHWVDLFNQTNDYRIITHGFIFSAEYRFRFGP